MELRSRGTRVFPIFLIFAIVLIASVIYYQDQILAPSQSTATSNNDNISVSGFKVAGLGTIGISGPTLLVQFNVKNPTPFGATLVNTSYGLYGDGVYLGKGTINETKIPAHAQINEETAIALSPRGSLDVTWFYLKSFGKITWEVKGNTTLEGSIFGNMTVTTPLHFDCISSKGSTSCNSVLG